VKNQVIPAYEAADLRRQVEKVLRGLGNPEPPLRLEDVRELLRLDRRYYSSTDDSAARETVSRLRIAGKQIMERPSLLIDVIRKAELSALWLPDRKRILIDAEAPILKHRWYESHEIGHSLAPWHRDYLYGDSEESLSPICREELEAEANYVAGQLLFMMNRFTDEARMLPIAIDTVIQLGKRYANTITSTLWRYVEEAHQGVPLVGIVTPSPRALLRPDNREPRRYCIESPSFRERFGQVAEQELRDVVESYVTNRRGGPLGQTDTILRDRNGDRQVFHFETFSNGHSHLTLGVYVRPALALVSVPSASMGA
jgi:hypothetical protein